MGREQQGIGRGRIGVTVRRVGGPGGRGRGKGSGRGNNQGRRRKRRCVKIIVGIKSVKKGVMMRRRDGSQTKGKGGGRG